MVLTVAQRVWRGHPDCWKIADPDNRPHGRANAVYGRWGESQSQAISGLILLTAEL